MAGLFFVTKLDEKRLIFSQIPLKVSVKWRALYAGAGGGE